VRRHLSFANVCSALALLVALSTGGAYAASKLITGKQIKNGTITAADVKRQSLTASRFKPGQLPAGPRGLRGLRGLRGPAGPNSFTAPLAKGTVLRGAGAVAGNSSAGNYVETVSQFPVALPASVSVRVKGTTEDPDDRCSGSVATPTAPAGIVCIYPDTGHATNVMGAFETASLVGSPRLGFIFGTAADLDGDVFESYTWAYTAG
jgi:hypothetical protein